MNRLFFTLTLLVVLLTVPLWSQSNIRDSLLLRSKNAATDSLRFEAYYSLTFRLGYSDSINTMLRLDTLLSKAPPGPSPWYQARVTFLRSQVQRHYGDSEGAKITLDKAIGLARVAGDSNKVADFYYAKARLYMPSGELAKTLKLCQHAFDLYREDQDTSGQMKAMNAMGMVQRQLGNFEQALAYYQKCYDLAQQHASRSEVLAIIANLAVAYQSLERYDEAITLYEEGLELASRLPVNHKRRAYLHTNLSGLYQNQGRFESSISELEKAYDFFEKQGSLKEKSAVAGGLAGSYYKLGRIQKAIEFATKGLAYAGDQKQLLADNHDLLGRSYRKANAPDSALVHFDKAFTLKSQLMAEANDKTVAELEARFQTREQKMAIDRMEVEAATKERRLRQRSYIIGITLMGLVLLGFLLWRNLRQRRQIEEQNTTIYQALKDKEILLKEIHHRVKNNLQMVSSLLNMQTHFIKDKAAADALQLGRSRVRSMALIHQKLYVGDTVSTLVDAKDYLERLAREVVDTHAPPKTSIKLRLDVEPLELDIDTVVPLGLITNEAVTNAVKYAFSKQEEGLLQISLWKRGDQHTLTIKDNGPGLEQPQRSTANDSFGQLLMKTLAEQLEGSMETKDTGNGMQLTVRF